MKVSTLLLTAALLLTTAAVAPSASPRQEMTRGASDSIPEEVYNRELKDLDGQSFFLSTLRGRVFVLNVWATWCGPCHEEIPELNKLREEYSAQGVEFVGLSSDSPDKDEEQVREYVAEMKMQYKILWLDGETFKSLPGGRGAIPQTFVVDGGGKVVSHFVGFSGEQSTKLWRKALDKALNPGMR